MDKDGVDPNPQTDHTNFKLTSDKFFYYLNASIKYDIVFIDGLHTYEQVRKDILNSLDHLSEKGYICLHDANPPTENHGLDYPVYTEWNGSVYKAIMELRATRGDLDIVTVDTDWGVTIISRANKNVGLVNYNIPQDLNWNTFSEDRVKFINLISIPDFCKKFNYV